MLQHFLFHPLYICTAALVYFHAAAVEVERREGINARRENGIAAIVLVHLQPQCISDAPKYDSLDSLAAARDMKYIQSENKLHER